jgi:FkbM family methyltransferase
MQLPSFVKNTNFWIRFSNSNLYFSWRYPSIYKRIQKDRLFYKKLMQDVKGKKIIFDVGANKGEKSRVFSEIADSVIAFEPSTNLYNVLSIIFKNSNVQIMNCALGSEKTSLTYYEIEGKDGYNSLSEKHIDAIRSKEILNPKDTITSSNVQVETLDSYISKYGTPQYIKIDVEGYEYEVIKGLKTPITLLSFEINLPHFREETINCINYLSELSNNQYKFNIVNDLNDRNFLFKDNLTSEEAKSYISDTKETFMEAFVFLT